MSEKSAKGHSAPARALPYRRCVGIMLANADGKVWTGRRIPKWQDPDRLHKLWQMPQGGIDKGETPIEAARRELYEETGARSVEPLVESAGWLSYDLPPEILGITLGGKYRGQTQKWFLMRFLGSDDEFDLALPGHPAEFDDWQWRAPEQVPELVVPFKRKVYEQVVAEFAGALARLA